MTWLTPTIAGIAALIAIPALVILYFLKLRRQTVEISSTLLWRKAIQDLQANAPFQKLRRNLLLFLQLLALAAILLAIAQPQQKSEATQGRRMVLLLDRSASMGAIDDSGGKTRLELAKQDAIALVDAMGEPGVFGSSGAGDQAMLIAFDAGGEVLIQFSSDKIALRDAINGVEQTDEPSSIREAYRLAQAQRPRRVLQDNAGGALEEATAVEVEGLVGGRPLDFHLFSDGRVGDLAEVVIREDKDDSGAYAEGVADSFEYHATGSPGAPNLAIVSLRGERDYENPNIVSIFVGVQSNDVRARSVDVELQLDGQRVAGIRTVELAAAEAPAGAGVGAAREPVQSGVVFELDRSQGFLAEIRLDVPPDASADALSADNSGVLVIPPAKRSSVAVVTRGNMFLSEVLKGLPLSRIETLTPSAFAGMAKGGGGGAFDVIVLDGVKPPVDPQGHTKPGRYLVLGAVPGADLGVVDKGEGPPTSVLDWSRTHPVLRDVVLDGLRIGQSRIVEVPDGSSAMVLAESPEGPAMLELGAPGVRAICVPWDVSRSNWPFDVGFVVFMASAVDYLAGSAAASAELDGDSRQLMPGEVLTARVPGGASDVRLIPPGGGTEQKLSPSDDGTVVYGPIRKRGLYRVRWKGEAGVGDVTDGGHASRLFAANLLDSEESDVGAVESIDLGSRSVVAAAQARVGGVRKFWPWLIGLALAIVMFEWWVYNRKVYL